MFLSLHPRPTLVSKPLDLFEKICAKHVGLRVFWDHHYARELILKNKFHSAKNYPKHFFLKETAPTNLIKFMSKKDFMIFYG